MDKDYIDMSSGNDSNNKESIIEVLLAEYNNVQQRVFYQIDLYDQANVKVLMLIGVLMFFGLSNYSTDDCYIALFVNCTFLVVMPIISIAVLLLTIADLVKVMILGDYLKIIENKINKVLEKEAKEYGINEGRVLNWEWWRINHGHVKGFSAIYEISFSLIIVILVILASATACIIRMYYLYKIEYTCYLTFFYILVVLGVLFVAVLIYSICVFVSRRRKTKIHVKNHDEVEYFKEHSRRKKREKNDQSELL